MVANAASWLSGVTPAQQEAMTLTGISGRYALIKIALETTQISVQSPTNVTVIHPMQALLYLDSGILNFQPL